MKQETILKRPDGTQIRLIVELHTSYDNSFKWRAMVHCRKKGAKLWRNPDSNWYAIQRLTLDEKIVAQEQEVFTLVTEQELQEAKLKLWNSMKPVVVLKKEEAPKTV